MSGVARFAGRPKRLVREPRCSNRPPTVPSTRDVDVAERVIAELCAVIVSRTIPLDDPWEKIAE